MDRRSFLKGALSTATLAAVGIESVIDKCIEQTSHLTDNEFIEYVEWIHIQMNLYVTNPGQNAIITDIGEE